MKLLVDMETGQRGFLVGGETKFLKPYLDGRRDLDGSFDVLAGLINGDVNLEEHLDNARHYAE